MTVTKLGCFVGHVVLGQNSRRHTAALQMLLVPNWLQKYYADDIYSAVETC
jgi:hypothetical protein